VKIQPVRYSMTQPRGAGVRQLDEVVRATIPW
jgi:hypothetical protein